MQAGRLDRRIVIESFSLAENSFGESAKTWSTYSTVWASVKTKGGKETFDSDQTVAETTTVFKIRFLFGITDRMRISYNGAFYNIQSVAEIGRMEGIEIIATSNNPS